MDYERSQALTLSRNELYEKIWNTPTIKLAKDVGLSDVAIGKICKKHSIPKPPLGYWAKLVPSIPDNRLEVIEIRKRPLVSGGQKTHAAELEKETPIAVPERVT